LKELLTVEELPPLVPRPLAAKFGFMSTRTLKNHEAPKGPLNPIKRNARSVSYLKEELLAFLGISEPAKLPKGRRAA
jgi:hypothetical protein